MDGQFSKWKAWFWIGKSHTCLMTSPPKLWSTKINGQLVFCPVLFSFRPLNIDMWTYREISMLPHQIAEVIGLIFDHTDWSLGKTTLSYM
jgi:hypothetical protein